MPPLCVNCNGMKRVGGRGSNVGSSSRIARHSSKLYTDKKLLNFATLLRIKHLPTHLTVGNCEVSCMHTLMTKLILIYL